MTSFLSCRVVFGSPTYKSQARCRCFRCQESLCIEICSVLVCEVWSFFIQFLLIEGLSLVMHYSLHLIGSLAEPRHLHVATFCHTISNTMALFRLSRKSCVFVHLFLVVNPLTGLFARGETKPPSGNDRTYRWQNRGCRAFFKSIYNNVKIDAEKLAPAFHSIRVDPTNTELHKELHVVFDRVAEFVRANPDKVAGAGSVAAVLASACLLYDSILLTHGIMVLFDRFEELRGNFNTFMNTKLPKIEKLLIETRQKIETGNVPDDKELRQIESVLLQYCKEITDVLDKVRDYIEEAIVAEWDAKFTAAVGFIVAAAAGIAVSPAVPVKGLVFKVGMVTTACLGTAAGVLSLRNAEHCKLAQHEMREFKKKVEDLKNEAWDWMLEVKMR